jgi:hypothetical protein
MDHSIANASRLQWVELNSKHGARWTAIYAIQPLESNGVWRSQKTNFTTQESNKSKIASSFCELS